MTNNNYSDEKQSTAEQNRQSRRSKRYQGFEWQHEPQHHKSFNWHDEPQHHKSFNWHDEPQHHKSFNWHHEPWSSFNWHETFTDRWY